VQGSTHLAFGTTASVAAVAVAGVGLGPGVRWHHLLLPWTRQGTFALPDLHPLAWLALIAAAGLGSLLPDIDQPGSLLTRLPAREGQAIERLTRHYSRGLLGGMPARLTTWLLVAATGLASALLGGAPGRGSAPVRLLLWAFACLFLALFVVVRWLPPPQLLALPVQARHLLALVSAVLAAGVTLLSFGGVAGVVHRLPGHHRGWTHAPPVALVLALASFALGPLLLPALPGVGPAFAVGYLSHLAADALTIRGIPLCWPGRQAPSLHLLPRPFRVRTGGAGERVFNACWASSLLLAILLLVR
jgi:LexA-binding, inner membrane-associated putative hydrolase